MFGTFFKKIKEKLNQNTFFENMSGVLKRTPTYAIHWYAVMLLGLVTVIGSVGTAWILFTVVSSQRDIDTNYARNTITIKEDALQEALSKYKERNVELERLKTLPPIIIDPGR